MGLLSFLFGNKKTPAVSAVPQRPSAELIAGAPDTAIVEDVQRPPTGVLQARVRLRMAAAMSRGRHADASDAARQLADMQAKAGRRVAARIWSEQARRIETKTVRP